MRGFIILMMSVTVLLASVSALYTACTVTYLTAARTHTPVRGICTVLP